MAKKHDSVLDSAMLQGFLENTPDEVYLKDIEGRFVYVSAVLAAKHGKTAAEIIGKTDFDFLSEESAKEFRRDEERMLEQGSSLVDIEQRETWADGKVTFVRCSKRLIYDSDGQVLGILGISHDITEYKQVEAQAHQTADLLTSFLESSPDSVYFKDCDGHFIRISKAARERFSARSDKGVIGLTDFDFFDKAHAEKARKEEAHILSSGEPLIGIEEREVWSDGSVTWARTTKIRLADDDGHIIGIFGVGSDISEQKKSEAQAREQEQLFVAYLENSPDAVFFKDADSRFLRVSKTLRERLARISSLEPIGRTDADFFDKEHADKALADEKRVLETGEPVINKEEREVWPDGSARWVRTTRIRLADDEGHVLGLFGVARDITNHKEAELEIERHGALLAQIIDIQHEIVSGDIQPEVAMDIICERTNEMTNAEAVSILVWEGEDLVQQAAAGFMTQFGRFAVTPEDFRGDTLRKTKDTLLVEEVGFYHPLAQQYGIRSMVAAPLLHSGKLIGQLCAFSTKPSIFVQEDKRTLELLAVVFSSTISHSRELMMLDSFMSTTADHVYFKDLAGRFIRISDAQARWLGLPSASDAIGKSDFDFFDKVHADRAYNDEQNIIRTGKPIIDFEEKDIWKDGHIAWVSTTKMPLKNHDGSVVGTFGISRNITERKAAELALEEHSKRLARIVETQRDITAEQEVEEIMRLICDRARELTRAEGACVMVREKGECIMRVGIGSVSSHEGSHLAHSPENTEGASCDDTAQELHFVITNMTQMDLASTSSAPLHHGEQVVGQLCILSSKADAFTGEDRNTIELLSVILSSSLSHLSEIETLDRFRTVFARSPIAISRRDKEGRSIESNPAMVELLGYDSDELAAMPFSDYVHSNDKEESERLFNELLGDKIQSYTYEERCRCKSDREIWVQVTAAAEHDTEGHPIGAIAMIEDITRRKRAEEERDIMEQDLRQVQKMEAVGQLAGGIAHDFNNLMMAISGHAELALLRDGPGEELNEDLAEIQHAAKRATELTRSLLDFSRQQEAGKEVVDFVDGIREMQRMLERLLSEAVEIKFDLGDKPLLVTCNPTQLEQIVLNLAVNARDAMEGAGHLDISLREISKDLGQGAQDYILLRVKDNGSGMSDETRERIFEPFFTTKEEGKGTGLGLSTVYGIVSQASGQIEIESEIGVGTSFLIYLPKSKGALGDDE